MLQVDEEGRKTSYSESRASLVVSVQVQSEAEVGFPFLA